MKTPSRSFFQLLLAVLCSIDVMQVRDALGEEAIEHDIAVIDSFTVAKHGDVLCIPVVVADLEKPQLCMIDTGAEVSAFDVSLAPRLGLCMGKASLAGPAGLTSSDMYPAPRVTAGHITFDGASSVLTVDMSAIRRATGHEVTGILGMDFLRRHTFRVDFDAGKIDFLRVSKSELDLEGKPIQVFYFGGNTPLVTGAASRKDIDRFIVDTGATVAGGVELRAYDRMISAGEILGLTDSRVLTVSGASQMASGRAELLAVKGFSVSRPVVTRTDANYLGLGFWSRFLVTFDFPRRTIYLSKGRRFEEPDLYNWSGICLVRDDDGFRVLSTICGSPADVAGVATDDRLLRVGNTAVAGISLFEVRRQIMLARDHLNVEIDRNGASLTFLLGMKTPAVQGSSLPNPN